MSLSWINRGLASIRRNTALDLTLRYAAVFLLCVCALFVIVDRLLASSQLEQDQRLLDTWLENYQRLESQVGLHKLEQVIERDAAFFQRSAMRLELLDGGDNRLVLVQPEGWTRTTRLEPQGGGWFSQQVTRESAPPIELLTGSVALGEGRRLQLGLSAEPREQRLQANRQLMVQVMAPLFLLGLLLSAYFNWRALRPVRDLVETVRTVRAREMSARVVIRNPSSELGELAQLFNEMLGRIEGLINAMQQSLDSVAHDLRTPLARMRLSLESALTRDPREAGRAEGLREALLDCAEESERIEGMLRLLLDLSAAQSGTLNLQPEPVDLVELLQESQALYEDVAQDKAIRLRLEAPAHLRFSSDSVRLRQVLANLVDNAIKYTPAGGWVEIGCRQQGAVAELWVADSGIGIAEADQAQIFERLYRADQSRHEPGMGLGLSLVKALVEALGGTVSVSSQPGQGSRFRVQLPAPPVAGPEGAEMGGSSRK
ncbi:sensor histidine kinase [Aestuariirhabdus litorea]|uniref:histidine kinase n=1 Tax=Aestuariirhabdus litorea TaxID=2528527 RepID=A0A3P3VT96_9GAMM|nr:HAMP domain-containing sensor histidine kinase [Aestuariirhabdus litorea]RRJ83983.1 sensor histidine kinase [Aestuariirhabdus litorea]RWW97203.1 HAMP domain-containing protein [Endozoicomonadaceae bacterium GTF-13]